MVRKSLSVLERIRESGLAKAPVIVRDSARRLIGKKLTDDLIVYRLDPGAYAAGPPVPIPSGLEVHRYERFADIPKPALARLHPEERSRIVEQSEAEFRNGAVEWIGFMDGMLAATAFSIRGRNLKRWYAPLSPDDLVIYATDTLNAFRGCGIHPAIIRAVIDG
jgi:hypothetical protein